MVPTALLLAVLVHPVQDVAGPGDAYLDPGAESLHVRARAAHRARERDVVSYEAVVRRRMAAALRTPLRDRTLYDARSASRVRWSRDGEVVVQLLASRVRHPFRDEDEPWTDGWDDQVFDPGSDRLYFGLVDRDDPEVWVEHPLAPGATRRYRFRTGDTLTISFPDGRTLRAVELQVLPRERSPRLLSGSLWVEPGSGALVRGVYRLARTLDLERDGELLDHDPEMERVPGIFRPFELEVSLATVEYAFRDGVWLPRRMRMEGEARAGILEAPAAVEVAYDFQAVELRGARSGGPDEAAHEVARRWRRDGARGAYRELPGRRRVREHDVHLLIPREPERLATSPELPPPIWEDAPGFATESELESLYEGLGELPEPLPAAAGWELLWGFQRPDLVRYNRVEGLSVGARVEGVPPTPVGPVEVGLTARVGFAAPRPDVRLTLGRASVARTLELSLDHGLVEVDPAAAALGLGNSASALLLGRDDGEYYRATRASLTWAPPASHRPWYGATLHVERHRSASTATHFSASRLFDRDRAFRPNLAAVPSDEVGVTLRLAPWWGADPAGLQGGAEVEAQAVAGDHRFARARLTLRGRALLAGDVTAALEAAGATTWGSSPPQRWWLVGGTSTLRGYPGSARTGPSLLRGRVELGRGVAEVGVAAFADVAWAGHRSRIRVDDALYSAGLGLSVLDGLLRVDLARALRAPTGWRLELYVDALL